MFKRRKPLGTFAFLKEFFWPSMGWVRALRYVQHRIVRLADSSRNIAIGLASGACVSFTPLVGTHFIQAGLIAYVLRGNLLASLVGTFVGNPWTFPFMWVASTSFGSYLFGLIGLPASVALPDEISMKIMWDILMTDPLRIFLPFAVGGYILALLSWPVYYFVFYYLVKGAKAARLSARQRRIHKLACEVTGQPK